MLDRKLRLTGTAIAIALGLLATSCASRQPVIVAAPQPAPVIVAPPPVVVQVAPAPRPDPIVELIAASTALYERGQREMIEGHLDMARTEFNRALEVVMESASGARADARLREHFDRLVERIHTFEVAALAKGDGFTEKKYEPATIDELLSLSTFDTEATHETTTAVAHDLAAAPPDIDIPLNARVLAYVQLFSGRLKGYLEEGLSRGSSYLPMIQDVFRAEGLPLDLAYVPLIESAFKSNALSKAKAKGMWQFMKGTGLENGLKSDWYIDERSDPEKATVAAAKYLKTLYKMFGDWHLALASYNGGPGRVQRALTRSNKDDFWALSSTKRYLPRETRDYVPLILAAVVVARNPAQYGLQVVPVESPSYEVVSLPAAVDLRHIAEWSGAPVDVIQDLNPELRRWTTPVRATDYEIKVPAGTADLVRAGLLETAPDALAPLSHHMVKKGETLLSISKKLKVNRADLAEANYLSAKAKLSTGQRLIIPRAPNSLDPQPSSPDVLLAVNAVDTVPDLRAAPDAEPAKQQKVIHKVTRGDTLSSIAKRYGTSVASLRASNNLHGSAIQVGQRLTIVKPRSVATN
jgi:membrane-bound lytic murein transglycosylase D